MRRVDGALIGVAPCERRGDLAVDVRDRLRDALAQIALLVAVAELERLALAGRRAGRHGGAADRAAFQHQFDFDGRVPARVQDLAAVHGLNLHSDLTRCTDAARLRAKGLGLKKATGYRRDAKSRA